MFFPFSSNKLVIPIFLPINPDILLKFKTIGFLIYPARLLIIICLKLLFRLHPLNFFQKKQRKTNSTLILFFPFFLRETLWTCTLEQIILYNLFFMRCKCRVFYLIKMKNKTINLRKETNRILITNEQVFKPYIYYHPKLVSGQTSSVLSFWLLTFNR